VPAAMDKGEDCLVFVGLFQVNWRFSPTSISVFEVSR
jgi:hypothetical protein